MAEIRKGLLAFAVVALLLSLGSSAYAQGNTPAFSCVANAGVPPIVRAEGITELVGDLILNCTGGTPTPTGQPIPLSNVQIFLNTNVTSRLYNTAGLSEAILTIDEPFPGVGANPSTAVSPVNAPQVQSGCQAVNNTNCAINGTAVGGIGGVGNTGPYNGVSNALSTGPHYNVFQGSVNGPSQVIWLGVPIDAPGTTGTRTIRITNIRANACQLGVSSTLIPTQIVEFVAVNGSQQVSINNPQQEVALIQPGLVASVKGAETFVQCVNINGNLLNSSSTGQTGSFTLRAQEGFASSFKVRNFAQLQGTTPATAIGPSNVALQNVLGFPYGSESGFVSNTTGISPNGTTSGAIGLADTGTQLAFTINNIGAGVTLVVPNTVYLTSSTVTGNSGTAVLLGSGGGSGTTTLTISGNAASIVYEIWFSNNNAIEQLNVPVTVAAISNTGQNLPALGVSTGTISFNPISSVNTASSTAPIPRFCNNSSPATAFTIIACSCNLLFPFVTNQSGFDTGVAIANTSLDVYGTAPQQGIVTLNYFGSTVGGGASPPAQKSQSIPAGSELIFNLSSGGNFGIQATPGFTGYIIAVANFQWCHAFAFISDVGAQRLAEGYLAIQLDISASSLNRTGQVGENEGH